MFNEPKGTDRPASTRHHQGAGTPHPLRSRIRARKRQLVDGRRRLHLHALARTAGHGLIRGAAGTLGASTTGWIIWWIQQR